MRTPNLHPAILLFGLALLVGSCRGQGGSFAPPKDGGQNALTCNSTADCAGTGLCVSGVCEAVKSCMTDSDCASEHKVCHSHRFYCVQCDGTHANECPANQTCQFDFTCVPLSSNAPDGGTGGGGDGAVQACSGTCTDRTMCSNDQVCSNGHCCPPPARCFSPADCPQNHPDCNGATGMCFGGDNCMTDADCEMKPGCAGGVCMCQIANNTPPGVCVMRANECMSDNDCKVNGAYVGKYCQLQMQPYKCVTAPMCTTNADCANLGLLCDTQMGSDSFDHCINGTNCSTGGSCPSDQTCVNSTCVPKNCLNTPNFCQMNQRCDAATGMCVNDTMGMCTQDTDCMMGYYCNTVQSPAVCELGCRTNADCPNGVCNAQHQCQTGMGGVCGMCTSSSQCPAGTVCVTAVGLCYQPCTSSAQCTMRQGSSCGLFLCTCVL
jgi:hypothetical protein